MSGLNTTITVVFSYRDCLERGKNRGDLTSWYASFWHIFIAHAHKRLFRSFQWKIWRHHSLRRPRFPVKGE